jgi:hypothetical protein
MLCCLPIFVPFKAFVFYRYLTLRFVLFICTLFKVAFCFAYLSLFNVALCFVEFAHRLVLRFVRLN